MRGGGCRTRRRLQAPGSDAVNTAGEEQAGLDCTRARCHADAGKRDGHLLWEKDGGAWRAVRRQKCVSKAVYEEQTDRSSRGNLSSSPCKHSPPQSSLMDHAAVQRELRCAVRLCRDRGLRQSAKW